LAKNLDKQQIKKMAKEINLQTEKRNTFGKKNKSLRSTGIIPVNMYGLGDSISLQVDEDILYKTLKEAGYTTPIKLSVDGKDETYTLVRNVDRHPVTDKLVHVDFLRVDMEKEIEVQVPVVLINQDSAPGTRGGAGVVTQGVYEVTILAKPLEIPSELEADCSILENLEMYVYAKDLNIPDGASLTSDEEAQIAWIQPPRVQEEVVEAVSEEGLEGEGETTEDGESSDSDSDGGEETSE
jgi:large subunit ribosomal protein L25|tara:strand:- start:405 stop:1121 length:717 start_codon:yes stop_codon:yes gene_type:complete